MSQFNVDSSQPALLYDYNKERVVDLLIYTQNELITCRSELADARKLLAESELKRDTIGQQLTEAQQRLVAISQQQVMDGCTIAALRDNVNPISGCRDDYLKESLEEDAKIYGKGMENNERMNDFLNDASIVIKSKDKDSEIITVDDDGSRRGEVKPYKCDMCVLSFATEKVLLEHEKKEHTSHVEFFTCIMCDANFEREYELMVHTRRHTGVRPYRCDVCDKCFSTNSTLMVHRRVHNGDKPFFCKLCERSFSQKSSLQYHEKTHEDRREFVCSGCPRTFILRGQLDRHIRVAHLGEKPFKCHLCNERFSSQYHLDSHTAQSHPDCKSKRHICDLCGKGYLTATDYKSHLRTHNGERPFCCDVCGKSFPQRNTLNQHVLIHSGLKLFACTTCGKSFNNASKLKRHLRVHNGERPFTCNMCSKSFKQSGDLKRHVLTHTAGKPNRFKTPKDAIDNHSQNVASVHSVTTSAISSSSKPIDAQNKSVNSLVGKDCYIPAPTSRILPDKISSVSSVGSIMQPHPAPVIERASHKNIPTNPSMYASTNLPVLSSPGLWQVSPNRLQHHQPVAALTTVSVPPAVSSVPPSTSSQHQHISRTISDIMTSAPLQPRVNLNSADPAPLVNHSPYASNGGIGSSKNPDATSPFVQQPPPRYISNYDLDLQRVATPITDCVPPVNDSGSNYVVHRDNVNNIPVTYDYKQPYYFVTANRFAGDSGYQQFVMNDRITLQNTANSPQWQQQPARLWESSSFITQATSHTGYGRNDYQH